VCAGQTIPLFCRDQTTWSCNYASVPNVELDAGGNLLAQETRCDGLDGNCNGTVDLDGFPTVGQACGAGLGVCRTSGTVVCTSPTASGCNAVPNNALAVDELCDGLDNNCDGRIDERANGNGHLGWKDAMVSVLKPGGGTVWVYAYEASRPGATSFSPGSLSSRACSRASVLPWPMLTETQAAAACFAVKDSAGQPMRLCTAAEWQAACEGPSGAGPSKWSQSVNPTMYRLQICNDASSSTPCVWATGTSGFGAGGANGFCYTDWLSGAKIYDLSGNLSEWTSSTLASGGATYYKLRGGSFSYPSGGTTCEFDVRWELPTAFGFDIGFRCCADNAP
jgi:hypothetical protein